MIIVELIGANAMANAMAAISLRSEKLRTGVPVIFPC